MARQVVLDLIDPDRSKYAQYFEGVHAVVHLGTNAAAPTYGALFDEKQNVGRRTTLKLPEA
jgi:hypothetical protein